MILDHDKLNGAEGQKRLSDSPVAQTPSEIFKHARLIETEEVKVGLKCYVYSDHKGAGHGGFDGPVRPRPYEDSGHAEFEIPGWTPVVIIEVPTKLKQDHGTRSINCRICNDFYDMQNSQKTGHPKSMLKDINYLNHRGEGWIRQRYVYIIPKSIPDDFHPGDLGRDYWFKLDYLEYLSD